MEGILERGVRGRGGDVRARSATKGLAATSGLGKGRGNRVGQGEVGAGGGISV